MEVSSFLKVSSLLICDILLACFVQSNYAEVCYLRSQRTYGACNRWFLPAEKALCCTSIKLGGYTTMFYKRGQIIEYDQPFISDDYEEVQYFIKNQAVIVQSEISDSVKKTQSPSRQLTDQQVLSTTAVETTTRGETSHSTSRGQSTPHPSTEQTSPSTTVVETTTRGETSHSTSRGQSTPQPPTEQTSLSATVVETTRGETSHSTSRGQSTPQPSTEQTSLSTTVVETTRGETSDNTSRAQSTPQPSTEQTSPSTTVQDITCPSNLSKAELTCTGGCDDETFSSCKDDPNCVCDAVGPANTKVKILTCGCNSTDTGTFIPLGFTHFSGTSECYCDVNGTTVCDTKGDCNGWETETWRCQFGNDGYERMSRLSKSRPSGCHELYADGVRDNGIYCVYPDYLSTSLEPHLKVYCDMGDWPQGGWTVIQRRVNGSVNFYRNWDAYKDGFGKLNDEFWLGNENIYQLTSHRDMRLRIDIESDAGKYYVLYSLFRIDNEMSGYQLIALGDFTNGAQGIQDSFRYHVNAKFSTYDNDRDLSASENCALSQMGGWWFTDCHMVYLNGVYGESQSPGIRWYHLQDGQFNIKSTEMKIQPV